MLRACGLVALLMTGGVAFAQAPVEDRAVRQAPVAAAQLKAEAAWAVHTAEQDLAAARLQEQTLEKRLAEARREREAAQRAAERARAEKKRADETLARGNAEVERGWGGGR